MRQPCDFCKKYPKNWEGSDPECMFRDNGPFLHNNWACGASRVITKFCNDKDMPEFSADDQTLIVIPFYGMTYEFLIATFYKHRGKMDSILLVSAGKTLVNPDFNTLKPYLEQLELEMDHE